MDHNRQRRVLLIGMDSASLDLVLRWKNHLPNLGRLMRQGSFGYLRSTIPPLSPPAWVSLVTGKNPAKTGIFDWIKVPGKVGEKTEIVRLDDAKEPKIWDILSREGFRSCIINLPLSYPPSKLSGVMVSGIPGHIADGDITYPKSLKEELDKAVGGYEVYPYSDLRILGREAEYIAKYERVLEKRTKATLHMMKNEQWDFFMIVFFVLDSVQHYFWKHMDSQHPFHSHELAKRFGDTIKDFYIKIDQSIGRLIEAVDGNTDVLVVSDHGMGPLYGCFLMNNLMRKSGLLSLKKSPDELSALGWLGNKTRKMLINVAWSLPEALRDMGGKILPFQWKERLTFGGQTRIDTETLLDSIDWKKTQAYALGEAGGIFFHNGAGCEAVKRILKETKCPFGGSKVKLYEKHDIYNGPYIEYAPDVICLIDGYRIRTDMTPKQELWSSPTLSGYHTEHGMFVAAGPSIVSVPFCQRRSIYDIMPTILSLFDIDVPSDLDGRSLSIVSKT